MEQLSNVPGGTTQRSNRMAALATRRSNSIGSSSNARRQTRSLNSDQLVDEVPADEDAARWAETIRQRRLSRKKRVEDEDTVLVGTRVSEGHTNWVTAYNMLTGIRVATSRCNAKIDRALTALDFSAKHKLAFDLQGNELTPSARYDFKFKDYAPWIFRDLRKIFQIDAADYLVSLTGKYILSELGSPGKSGSFFYFSRDYRFIIKTLHHAEHRFLRKVLPDYHKHAKEYPNTLISQFYGLHRVKTSFGKKIHFVVMNNLFPPHMDIHSTYDVKGSTVGRITTEDDKKGNPRGTLKDLNWLNSKQSLKLSPSMKKAFLDQVQRDVELLAHLKIMDYSLLMGVHNMKEVVSPILNMNSEIPDRAVQSTPSSPTTLVRTPSVSGQNYRHRDLRRMVTPREGPITLSQLSLPPLNNSQPVGSNHIASNQGAATSDRPFGQTFVAPLQAILSGEAAMTQQQSAGMQHNIFYQFEGGIRSQNTDGTPGDSIYFLGIIDLLTNYGPRKRLENLWKGFGRSDEIKSQISAVPPQRYANRFRDFVSGMTKSPSELEKARLERTPSAVNLEAAMHELDREKITSETREPDMTLAALQPHDESEEAIVPVLESSQAKLSQTSSRATTLTMESKRRLGASRDRLQEADEIQEARRASLDELQGTQRVRRDSIISLTSEPVAEEVDPDGHDSGLATSLDCLPEESEPSRQSSFSRPAKHGLLPLSSLSDGSMIESTFQDPQPDLAPPLEHSDQALLATYETNGDSGQFSLGRPQSFELHRHKLSAEEKALRRRGVIEGHQGEGIQLELQKRASHDRGRSHATHDGSVKDEGYGEDVKVMNQSIAA